MDGWLQRHDAVKAKTRWASPYDDIAVLDGEALCFAGPLEPAKEKDGGNAQRNGDDGMAEVALILVLMQREFGTGMIAVDEAGVGSKPGESGLAGGGGGEAEKYFRHSGPVFAGLGICGAVTVAGFIGYPAEKTTVGHGDGHLVASGCDHMAEWSRCSNFAEGLEDGGLMGQSKTVKKDRAGSDFFILRTGIVLLEEVECHCFD